MKRNIILSILLSSTLLFTACKKDFLDRQPQGEAVDANFYKTEKDAIAAINAAYDVLQWGQHNDIFIGEWYFGDICSDDARKGGENEGDMAYYHDLESFIAKPSNPAVDAQWKALYIGIYRCNLVISKIPDIEMDAGLKSRIVAEAKFLRAYYYFFLVRLFGGVPIVTTPLAPSEYVKPRASVQEVYNLIESDLKDAAMVLPEKSQYSSADMGRATRGAANGLLLRVYIFQKKWSLAQPLGETIIGSKEYGLDSSYAHIFTVDGENGIESVFEIQHSATSEPGWGKVNEGNLLTILQGSRGSDYGWGFNCPTQDFVNEFEPGDPRLEHTVIFDGEVVNGAKVDNKDSPTRMHSHKYVLKVGERPSELGLGGNIWFGQLNVKVIRYADILLMTAEAAYHNGDETTAKKYLNQVRKRAREGNNSILPDVTSSGPALLEAIYHERRVELGMEALRFFDIVRQGRAGQVMRGVGYSNFIDGVHELFPIPQAEIDITGGIVNQNPGY
ncbi:MAG TPA: RagB/SusD family nutrient uptake outer membrane protein [Cytophagaceae bacterium]